MSFTGALRAAHAAYRSRPVALLAAYFLSPAAGAAARVVAVAGLAVAYAYLLVTDRLQRFRAGLKTIEAPPPNPGKAPDAFAAWIEQFTPLLEAVFPPTVVALLAVTIVGTAAVFVVVAAVASAAQLAACRARLSDASGSLAAIAGARRYWRELLALFLIEALLVVYLTAVAIGLVALAATASPVLAVAVGLVLGPLWLAAVVGLRVAFAFAPVAVVVEDVAVPEGLRGAVRFVRSNTVPTVAYLALVVVVLALLGSLTTSLGTGGSPFVAVLGFVATAPALDLVKTALYADDVADVAPPPIPEATVSSQLRGGLRRSLAETATFVRHNPGLHVVAAASVVAGFLAGWTLAAPYEGLVTASIDARLVDHFPPTAAVAFATNNWSVAVATAFSGVALLVPSVVALGFNGLLLGVLGRLEVDPAALAAFVLPHGIIEIPALVVAGALGISLGTTALRTYRGRLSRTRFADELERAVWIAVGLGLALAVAGLIEGFVSPYYFRPFLGS